MAHMIPVTEHMSVYFVETTAGTELIPEDVCGNLDLDSDIAAEQVADYVEGKPLGEYSRKTGWYGRLSAPGYLDCTEWEGPFDTEAEALKQVCDHYEVDENGEELPEADETDEPIDRRALGELMQHWHASMRDPYYAVGSFYFDGNVYPSREVVEQALSQAETDEGKAKSGAHGWGEAEVNELQTIQKGLKHYISLDY